MRIALGLAVAGAAGVLARYYVDHGVRALAGGPGTFPWGTFVINVSAAFLAGMLYVLFNERWAAPDWIRLGLTVGFLGGFSTFSTLTVETYRLIQVGQEVAAGINAAGSLLAGMAAVFLGTALARTLPG